jgi:hypothetical protein
MAPRLPVIVVALLTLTGPLLAACGGQARPAATPQATAAANPGPAHLQITQLTVGTVVPIEGSLSYIRVERANGAVLVVRQLAGKRFVIKVDPGIYRLASWQSICDGNCGNLDPPTKQCERTFSVRQGERLQATIQVNFASLSTPCVIVLRR